MRLGFSFVALSLSLFAVAFIACTSDSEGDGQTAASGDGGLGVTLPDGSAAVDTPGVDSGAPNAEAGASGACGAFGPKQPTTVMTSTAAGFAGYWMIDDAVANPSCANGVSILIGYVTVAGATDPDPAQNGCAVANGVGLPYSAGRTKECFGALQCIAPEQEIVVVVDGDSKIASVFAQPHGEPRGKYVGSATLVDANHLKVSFTGGSAGVYIRGGSAGTCDKSL